MNLRRRFLVVCSIVLITIPILYASSVGRDPQNQLIPGQAGPTPTSQCETYASTTQTTAVSPPPALSYSLTFSQSGLAGVLGTTWGVTINGVRHVSNASSLTVDNLSGPLSYSYDCSVTVPDGTLYSCIANCSGTLTVTEPTLSRLHVSGNKILDTNGNAVFLKGTLFRDGGDPWGERPTEADFKYLAEHWDARIIRLIVTPEFWRDNPNYLYEVLDPEVQWANKYGMYAMINWISEGNINTPGVGANSGQSLTNLTETLNFWTTISEHFSGRPGVLYKINGEAAQISWSDWRNTAQTIVDRIREYDNQTILIVSGVNFSCDLSQVASNPVQGSNIVYDEHPYLNSNCVGTSTQTWDTLFGNPSKTVPVIVGEWGYYTPDQYIACHDFDYNYNLYSKGYDSTMANYLESKGISWMAWGFDTVWCPVELKGWDGYLPTQYGRFIQALLTTMTPPSVYARSNSSTTISSYATTQTALSTVNPAGVLAVINVHSRPMGIDFASGNVYVVNSGDDTVSVINQSTDGVVETISVNDLSNGNHFSYPTSIAYNPSNHRLYVTDTTGGGISMIDSSSNTIANTITGVYLPYAMTYSSSNKWMYITLQGPDAVIAVNSTDSIVAFIRVGALPSGIAYDQANKFIYVANSGDDTISVINATSNSVVTTVRVGTVPMNVAYDPADNSIFVANYGDGTVSVIDGAINKVVSTVKVSSNPLGLAYDSATNAIYVANSGNDTVSVIAGSANTLVETLSAGTAPQEVAFNPVTNYLYVTNGDGTVYVMKG